MIHFVIAFVIHFLITYMCEGVNKNIFLLA